MRLLKAALVIALSAAVAACSSSTAPLTPSPSPALARGSIISMAPVVTITKAKMTRGLAGLTISELGGPPQCDVKLYAIKYATIGVNGEPADASAAFFVPAAGCKGPFPLVGYAQGTNVNKAQMITNPTPKNIEPTIVAAIYAAHGYAVAATDYLGLGFSSYPYQPYLVDDAEASAVIDSMRAVRRAAKSLHVPLSRRVYLTGHSQGGQASMATQRAMEAENAREFDLIEAAPSSGPYDLTRTTVDGVTHPGQNAPILATYLLTSYQHVYQNVYANTTDAFAEPYAQWIGTLLPVPDYAQAARLEGQTIPRRIAKLFVPAFEQSFVHDPNSGARMDVAENDLLKGWKPVAPVHLCGGSRDPQVEFVNSQLAYTYFTRIGASVTLTDVNPLMPPQVPRSLYHDAVLVLCLTVTRAQYFDKSSGARPASRRR